MEGWYRRFLLILAAGIYCMIPLDLALSGHTGDFVQWIPFMVSGLALASLITWYFLRSRWALVALRWVMALSCAVSFLGGYEHFAHNLEFELEIRPGSVWTDVFTETVTGASPLLAPGILFLAGILVLAALYRLPEENTGVRVI